MPAVNFSNQFPFTVITERRILEKLSISCDGQSSSEFFTALYLNFRPNDPIGHPMQPKSMELHGHPTRNTLVLAGWMVQFIPGTLSVQNVGQS